MTGTFRASPLVRPGVMSVQVPLMPVAMAIGLNTERTKNGGFS
jgi:hypothetical protein